MTDTAMDITVKEEPIPTPTSTPAEEVVPGQVRVKHSNIYISRLTNMNNNLIYFQENEFSYINENGFTSEIFKIEVRGLPKFYGVGVNHRR